MGRYQIVVNDIHVDKRERYNQYIPRDHKSYFVALSSESDLTLYEDNVAMCEPSTYITANDICCYLGENEITSQQVKPIHIVSLDKDCCTDVLELYKKCNYKGSDIAPHKVVALKYTKGMNNLTLSLTSSVVNQPAKLVYIVDTESKRVAKKKEEFRERGDKSQSQGEDAAAKQWIHQELALGDKIWLEFNKSIKNKDFIDMGEEGRLSYFRTKYSNFNKKHPLCMRYIVQAGQYNHKAFRRYLQVTAASTAKGKDVFFERQADYIKLLYREGNPKCGDGRAKEVWEGAYKLIKDEDKIFEESQEKANELSTMITSQVSHELKLELEQQMEELNAKGKDVLDCVIPSSNEILIKKYMKDEAATPAEDGDSSTEFSDD